MGNTRRATVDWPYAGPAAWRIGCRQSWLARSWKGNEHVQVSLQMIAPGSPLADTAVYSALDDGQHIAQDGVGDVAQNIVAPLTVILSITGGYLWLVPYLSKWQRGRQAVASQSHLPHVAHN